MRTTNINISLDPAKEGKWYAQENVTKKGDATVTFFQRDGKQTFLQKFKYFRNGVRSGTELASKYIKELGLPPEAFSTPKKSKETISNDQLNQIFGSTYRRLEEKISFEESDLLVSHFDREENKQVNIKINQSLVWDDETIRESRKNDDLSYFQRSLFKTNNNYSNFDPHLRLAIEVRDKPNFSAKKDEIETAKKALTDIKTTRLKSLLYQTTDDDIKIKGEFDAAVDILSKAFDTAIAKASLQTPTT